MQIHRRAVLLGLLGMAHSAVAARLTPLERLLAARMAAKQIPGASLAVVRRGRTVVCDGYGLADVQQALQVTAKTLFPMASASKLLAGLAAMLLVEAGRLDLEAPVSTYVPEMTALHGLVRVRHLLNMTSGLNGPGTDAQFRAEAQRRQAQQSYVDARKLELFEPEELIAVAARLPSQSEPGAAWRYDQFPWFLLGQIIARVTGTSYDLFVERALFNEIGMSTATFGDSHSAIPGRVTSYSRESGTLQPFALRYTPSFWAAAGCNASAADLVKLWSALRPGRVLTAASLRRMFQPTRLASGEEIDYGLGCTVGHGGGRTWIGHEGGGCCYLGWWPVEQLGIAVMFNLTGTKEDGIEGQIADLIFQ